MSIRVSKGTMNFRGQEFSEGEEVPESLLPDNQRVAHLISVGMLYRSDDPVYQTDSDDEE